ncbi:MAG: pyruvate ferredoxin oxidoreductase [Spirochaetes bacterium]|nr:pyruvate ferredoxin oxidoreductase [Spirochaetota bacterium]
MAVKDRLTGNEAVAYAVKQVNPDVFAAFPITPSTDVPMIFSSYLANGEVTSEFVLAESEHSAMSACIGAACSGARTLTATSACGLALMWELLYVASGMRLPIMMPVINRAFSAPLNINCDHSDSMGARDTGWIQLYAENNQEAYDNYFIGMRIGEHKDVLLPVMSCQDGFITSHGLENIDLIEDDKVKKFIGNYSNEVSLINPKHPVSMGPYDIPFYYMEHKYQQVQAVKNAKKVIPGIFKEFGELTGRKYSWFEEYKMEDAERAIIILNSSAGTAKAVVDQLRAKGEKVGLIKIRVYRPFPMEEIAAALSKVKAVAVMDKADSFSNCGGPVYTDVRHACYDLGENRPKIINFIYGLGGRDVQMDNIAHVYEELKKTMAGSGGELYRYLGLRE